jgi:hypothetical protein
LLSLSLALSGSLSLASMSGCAGDAMTGTWQDLEATTPLPDVIGGGNLNVDATVILDETVEPATFDILFGLAHPEGLSDEIRMHGTCVADGTDLTLRIDGFTIAEGSMNTASVGEDGSQCITLSGFGGAQVCFPAEQTNGYVLNGDSLAMTINQSIIGAPLTETNLALTLIE